MINIKIFNISSDQKTIQVSLETSVNKNITSVKLWNNTTYKNNSKVIDLSSKLLKLNNKEVFLISLDEAKMTSFEGIFFLEIKSSDILIGAKPTISESSESKCINCTNPITAVTANFNNIKLFILDGLLKIDTCNLSDVNSAVCSSDMSDIINVNMLLKGVITALSLGYYNEGLDIYNSLLKVYITPSTCNICKSFNYKNNITLGYGILNNTLILI